MLPKCQFKEYKKDNNSFTPGKVYFKLTYENKFALSKIADLVLVDGKKRVNQKWLDKVDVLGLAYWFMDDGTSSFTKGPSIMTRFCTLSFDDEEISLLRSKLDCFDIRTIANKTGDGGTKNVIYVKQNSINNLMNLISPFIVPVLQYKIKRRV